ncbi:WD repeat-containing protein 55 [Marchantia polymorpha subsp. ruderalis]|uniref:WD repeat-containing protein 55 n=2 Tax=Marchantia polymorpha TaxID=3197 RepID=A0A176WIB8_MARPO|nr:hypothetical protein AXG93_673s1250 [Marchantia polymorpha subsp. ruderalis]PTQ40344.1 hypothetical protein MARPO_0040s0029 [Marchantia polymorpha]BBN03233.1 hypothetical protein Mp_2g21860 [Marchantia polymorpha subsp. ruderalis]|eukprot:PTQ40344.1 hypothetical protein MARPO_0040s0029 [Marchantia polymorpha]
MAGDGEGGAVELQLGAQPFDLAFHPTSSIVAVGVITGSLQLFKYEAGAEPQKLWTVNAHTESCRGVRFAEGGRFILSASADHSILATDPETGQAAARLTDAHDAAINRIVNATETTVATGDDEGTIKIWDTRQNSCVGTFDTHEDFIADMEYVPASHQLLGASGDGTLSLCNLRRMKVDAQSQFAEDELLSVVVVKNGRKVVCGSQEGILLIYSWGYFADCSDRFVGHPNSVDALLKLDEETLITGSSDGMIRVVSILPNKMIGVIGEHADFPVERLAFSSDKSILGSASHDNTVKLWDVKYLLEEDEGIEEERQEANADVSGRDADASVPNGTPAQAPMAVDSDEEMDSDEDQGAGSSSKKKKKGKKVTTKNNTFFDGLL